MAATGRSGEAVIAGEGIGDARDGDGADGAAILADDGHGGAGGNTDRAGGFGGGGDSGGLFDQLRSFALGDKAKAALQSNPEFLKFVEGGVFPLKLATIENGQPGTIMEVTSVEQKPLDDSLFAIPADYKKMEIPGIPGAKN